MNEEHIEPSKRSRAPGEEIPEFPPDPHILDYLLLVAAHKRVVIFLVVGSVLLTLGLTFIVPFTFESEAMLLPPDHKSSSGLLSSLNAGGALKILKEIENPSVDLIQDLLESYSLSDRLSQDSSIHHYFARPGETRQQLVGRIQSALLTLPGYSSVNVRGTLSTGWFPTKDEKARAQRLVPYLANLACRTMDTTIGEVLRSDAKRARLYADSDYQRQLKELDSLDEVKERFEQKNGVPALDAQTEAAIREVSQLGVEVVQARIHLNLLERDLSSDAVTVQAARAKLEEAQNAETQYEVGSAIGPGLDTLPAISHVYAELLRKEAVLEPIVAFLRDERDQQDIFAERVRSVITIVDTAKVPDSRFSPKRVPMMALGLSGGVFLSILYLALIVFLRIGETGAPALEGDDIHVKHSL